MIGQPRPRNMTPELQRARTEDGRSFIANRMQRFTCISKLCLGRLKAGLVLALVLGINATPSAQAQSYMESTIYTFTDTPDGASLWAGLIRDKAGNLYGTTVDGGEGSGCYYGGCGTVFKVDANGKETVLHSSLLAPRGSIPSKVWLGTQPVTSMVSRTKVAIPTAITGADLAVELCLNWTTPAR